MAAIYIKNGRAILGDQIADNTTIGINDGKISFVGKDTRAEKRLLRPARFARGSRGSEVIIINAGGCFVSSGFIDCHIHGEPEKIFFNEARYGTTAFVAAESCAPLNHIYKRAESIKEFIKMHPFGPNVLGLRLEGPYISKAKAGAQNTACIRNPNIKEILRLLRKTAPVLKIMTIAPELKNALPLIRILDKKKIIASIGHSDAAYEEAVEGIDAGISHSTHTFNCMRGIDRREPGAAGAVLADERVIAEVIMDAVHVHPALFRLILKAKGPDKTVLITDSIRAEVPPGAKKAGVVYKFQDGTITGSSISMIDALRNAVKLCRLAIPEAVRLITLSPAKLLGIERRKGSLGKGKDADIVVFDKNFDVKMTMIRGRIAFIKGHRFFQDPNEAITRRSCAG
jgi:N-acetylglucosamine-6-phosphate deacetylase